MGCRVCLFCCLIIVLLTVEVAMEGNTTELYRWNATREERQLESRPAAIGGQLSNSRSTTKERTAIIPIEVLDSGIENVEQYDTVIFFYLQVESLSSSDVNISVSPDICCVFVEKKDIICGQLMVLAPPVILQIDEYTPAKEARFMYRNLYATHRRGNCTFNIMPLSNSKQKWNLKHVIKFDTYPDGYDIKKPTCNGVDLDPDRSCTPVDCVIKYEGLRNFFRDSTKKCEEVVDCDTRGKDGVSIVAYFDWEDNTCVSLYNEESATYVEDIPEIEIPIEFDPERNQRIPDIEYSRQLELTKEGKFKLKCNHGYQEGGTCVCNEGWRSSGIHATNLLEFNYCDQKDEESAMGYTYGPRRFAKGVEIVIISVMSTAIILLTILWIFLAYKFTKAAIPKRSRSAKYGLLEEVVPHSLK